MATAQAPLPARHNDLLLTAGSAGRFVAKNRASGTYFELGEQEYFLLKSLDGEQTVETLVAAFADRFGEPLDEEDLWEFIKLAEKRGLLRTHEAPAAPAQRRSRWRPKGNILSCRINLFDPDRVLNWLEPKLRFCFTPWFVVVSAALMALAGTIVWGDRQHLVTMLGSSWRWQTVVLFWITIVVTTLVHEFAHGLTCKHHGGEVHEIGVLLMFFTPCFYCNVSDAWLIREKSKRLWITFAGAYCDMCLWALAVFAWRLTIQDTLFNYIAWAVLTVCGTRTVFNLNPFVKMDGYYLLIDWLEVPNLRRRAKERWMSYVRWVLWGAPRPDSVPHGTKLMGFGGFCWLSSALFLDVMFIGFCKWLGGRWGFVGFGLAFVLAALVIRRLFRGFFAGEFTKMLETRQKRTALWIAGVVVVPGLLFIGKFDDRTGGAFQVRPGVRAELRAPVAGFLRDVRYDEGDQVTSNETIVRLEVPDLTSQINRKQAELTESKATLRKLQAGTRPEQLAEARQKVARATSWRDLSRQDLDRATRGMKQELHQLDEQIRQYQSNLEFAGVSVKQAEKLFEKGALAGQQFMAEKRRYIVAESQYEQARAAKMERETTGTLQYETELARRDKDLADAKAELALLEAGTRPEDIEAEKARLARLQEEAAFLQKQFDEQIVKTPVTGLITTGRLREKIGQYFDKGALICVVEDVSGLEAEIALPEQEVNGVKTGQMVQLKARALPFRTFEARVDRIAPAAAMAEGAVQSTVVVYCRVKNDDNALRSGMTGFGRISRGPQPLATIITSRALRYFRTEFWW